MFFSTLEKMLTKIKQIFFQKKSRGFIKQELIIGDEVKTLQVFLPMYTRFSFSSLHMRGNKECRKHAIISVFLNKISSVRIVDRKEQDCILFDEDRRVKKGWFFNEI